MIVYILETLVFQLVFLLTYDLFLKKETFFQWNRFYLLVTFLLSLVLPWVKLEMLRISMPQELGGVTVFLTQLDGVVLTPHGPETNFWTTLPWYYWVLGVGSIMSALWFGYKLLQILKLKRQGKVVRYPDFVKVTVQRSSLAFSFFRNIFMGAEIQKEKEAKIIAHELVHVKQKHTLDLLFFELARIVFWFNPLVYVYQGRVAELHEFIADAHAVKDNKREHFEMLLSEAFKTQHISFVNQFFNKSLIKKRIVMLQKKRSKAIWQLKYVLLLPLVLGMLVYTSCESESEKKNEELEAVLLDEIVIVGYNGDFKTYTLNVKDLDALTAEEESARDELMEKLAENSETGVIVHMMDQQQRSIKMQVESGAIKSISVDKQNQNGVSVPFGEIDEVPVFPGCEDAMDKRTCFQEKIQEHIRKHFRYPEEAQAQGIQGRVSLIFTIDTDGTITGIRKRGPHELLENEAVRIIERLPQMQPGKQDGEMVKVPFSIPITFRLQGNVENVISPQRGGIGVPFAVVEEVPVFPGCEDAADKKACFTEKVQEHIRKHFRYPQVAQEQGIQGRVSVIFTIGEDGTIADIRKRGPHELLENEAVRIIERLPQMQPGKQKGKVVEVPFSIPITFKLAGKTSGTSDATRQAKDYIQVAGGLQHGNGSSHYKGKVTDSEPLGLPGVNISIQGTEKGAVTDFDGNFAIAVEEGQVLSFQYKGLPTKTIEVTR
ncbi:TonB family protein [Flagellimonas sp.]|uniref:TonB family protein n=1 Tax=Flagellimonas sp. TaxID=2058762 RepID=UPI003AB3704D